MDVVSLRSGEQWADAVRNEIVARDVLWLFWSRAASASRYVETEWRIALEAHGIEGITPAVPVQLPSGRRLFVRTRLLGDRSLLVTLTSEVMRERALYELLHQRFHLSVREQQLIALLRAGYSNEQIGRDLRISVGTVKQYMNRMFKTFDVHSRGALVALVERIARDRPG